MCIRLVQSKRTIRVFFSVTGFSAMALVAHPLGLLLGIFYGSCTGFLLQYVPSPTLVS